jgi:uncharacterized lipoprotein YajG
LLKFGDIGHSGYLRPRIFNTKLKKTLKMKKVFAIFAIAALTACGGASTEATTDSAATTVDTAAVATDSSAVVADSTAVDSAAKK